MFGIQCAWFASESISPSVECDSQFPFQMPLFLKMTILVNFKRETGLKTWHEPQFDRSENSLRLRGSAGRGWNSQHGKHNQVRKALLFKNVHSETHKKGGEAIILNFFGLSCSLFFHLNIRDSLTGFVARFGSEIWKTKCVLACKIHTWLWFLF